MERRGIRSGWRAAACGCVATLVVIAASGTAQPAQAEEDAAGHRIVVLGSDWMASTSLQRQAFLVGVANMIVAESAYAKRHGRETPPASGLITEAFSGMKLDEIEARITSWYDANPDRLSMPVMGVVWKGIAGR
jgi:hypothetical protein